MKNGSDTLQEAFEKYERIEKEMQKEIDLKLGELKSDFIKIKSPDPSKLVSNTLIELKDLLYGDNSTNPTLGELRGKKHWIRNYIKNYTLKGKMNPIDVATWKTGYLGGGSNWTIEAEAKHKFYLWLSESEKNFTHREYLIAHEFKVQAGKAKPLTPTEMKDIAVKRYQQSFTLNKNKKESYKAPKKEELENVLILLNDFPEAKKLAQQEINNIL